MQGIKSQSVLVLLALLPLSVNAHNTKVSTQASVGCMACHQQSQADSKKLYSKNKKTSAQQNNQMNPK